MAITVTVRLKNDTGKSAIDRLTGDATLTGAGVTNEVVYIYEADRLLFRPSTHSDRPNQSSMRRPLRHCRA